jgi:hypothetical protein
MNGMRGNGLASEYEFHNGHGADGATYSSAHRREVSNEADRESWRRFDSVCCWTIGSRYSTRYRRPIKGKSRTEVVDEVWRMATQEQPDSVIRWRNMAIT